MLIKLLLFPFRLLMMIAGFILSLFGKALTIVIGLVMIAGGIISCLSIVGLIPGIILVLVGASTVLKGLF